LSAIGPSPRPGARVRCRFAWPHGNTRRRTRRRDRTTTAGSSFIRRLGYRFDRFELRLDGRNLNNARAVVSESEVGDAQYYRMTARDVRVSLGIRL